MASGERTNPVRTTRATRTGQPPPLPLPDYSFVGLAAHQMSSVRSSLSQVASALSWKIARYVPPPCVIRNTHLSRSIRVQTCTSAISSPPPPRLACLQPSPGVSVHEYSTLTNLFRVLAALAKRKHGYFSQMNRPPRVSHPKASVSSPIFHVFELDEISQVGYDL